jgi:hypothetical protein
MPLALLLLASATLMEEILKVPTFESLSMLPGRG